MQTHQRLGMTNKAVTANFDNSALPVCLILNSRWHAYTPSLGLTIAGKMNADVPSQMSRVRIHEEQRMVLLCNICSIIWGAKRVVRGEFSDVVRARLSAAWLEADKGDKALFRAAIPPANTGQSQIRNQEGYGADGRNKDPIRKQVSTKGGRYNCC